MRTLSHWLLGGALTASLTWNWTLLSRFPRADAPGATACELQSVELGLGSEEHGELAAVCASACRESDRLERQADDLQERLLASLAEPELDEVALTRLADEVSELRRRALAACVRGVLEVRRILSPDEVEALLECCESQQASCGTR